MSDAVKVARKLSPSMRRAVVNMAKGLDIATGLSGQSQFGGLEMTRFGLLNRGILENRYGDLSAFGREVADALIDRMSAKA